MSKLTRNGPAAKIHQSVLMPWLFSLGGSHILCISMMPSEGKGTSYLGSTRSWKHHPSHSSLTKIVFISSWQFQVSEGYGSFHPPQGYNTLERKRATISSLLLCQKNMPELFALSGSSFPLSSWLAWLSFSAPVPSLPSQPHPISHSSQAS